MQIIGPATGMSGECAPILRALPEWFGIPAAVERYLQQIDSLPTLIARIDGRSVGFVALLRHFPHTAEILVMGVAPEHHRCGVGGELLRRAESYLRGEGVEFVQVKTLAPSHPDRAYHRTRLFYAAMGYRPLEELEGVWGPDNPCLLMVRHLGS